MCQEWCLWRVASLSHISAYQSLHLGLCQRRDVPSIKAKIAFSQCPNQIKEACCSPLRTFLSRFMIVRFRVLHAAGNVPVSHTIMSALVPIAMAYFVLIIFTSITPLIALLHR